MYAFVWPTPDPGQGRYWPQGAGGRSETPGSAWATNGKALFQGPYHASTALTTWVNPPSGAVEKAVEIVEHMFYNEHSNRPGKEGKSG